MRLEVGELQSFSPDSTGFGLGRVTQLSTERSTENKTPYVIGNRSFKRQCILHACPNIPGNVSASCYLSLPWHDPLILDTTRQREKCTMEQFWNEYTFS